MLAPYAIDPTSLPNPTLEAPPPCVDFEVVWERGNSSNVEGNIIAKHHNLLCSPPRPAWLAAAP